MLKEPVILKAKSSLSSPSSQCPSSILQGKPSDRNVCCGDGFFRTTDPSRDGGFFQKRDTEMTASEFDNVAKSSIHSIMKKKSPCRGRSELYTSDREPNKENSSFRNQSKGSEDLRMKVAALEYRVSYVTAAKNSTEQDKKQLYDNYQHLSKAFEQSRLNNELLTRYLNGHRVYNQMLKSRLSDRTVKLEECLGILKNKYNHFERTAEKNETNQQAETFRSKTLEADMVRLKEYLVDLYQQNYELKGELENMKNDRDNMKLSACVPKEYLGNNERELLIQWKANLEQYYKSELNKVNLKLKHQRYAPCYKCSELCRIVIALNDELNEYRRQDSLDTALVATEAFGEANYRMVNQLSQEPSATFIS